MRRKSPTSTRRYVSFLLIGKVLLLLFLTGFDLVPLYWQNENLIVTDLLNGSRDQRVVKDILELRAHPNTEAIAELQSTLPAWESGQNAIANDPSPAIHTLYDFSRIDFAYMDTAIKNVLAHPDKPIDPVQAQIVLDHEWPYYLSTIELQDALSLQLTAQKASLIFIQWIINIFLLIAWIWFYIFVRKLVRFKSDLEEEDRKKIEEATGALS